MHPDVPEGFNQGSHRDIRTVAASLALQREMVVRDAGELVHSSFQRRAPVAGCGMGAATNLAFYGPSFPKGHSVCKDGSRSLPEGKHMAKPIRSLVVAALALIMPTGVAAQVPDLSPISEYLKLPADSRDEAYPLLRCIGLFQGAFRYGGASFSEEQTLRAQLANESMGLVALMTRQGKHPEIEVAYLATQIGKEIKAITVVYEERMTANYTLTGEAWDATMTDDIETCGPIVQSAIDKAMSLSTP